MRPIWMTRVLRAVNPPLCRACERRTEGGLVCDECGQRYLELARDLELLKTSAHPPL